MKPFCIYHGNCADGFGAAWVVCKYFGDGRVDFHAGVYQELLPDVTDRDVVMVDFSYKLEPMRNIIKAAHTVLVIDHHKTALEVIEKLVDVPLNTKFSYYFDLERSGAGLTWDYYFNGQPRPALIDHIEDRDLWKFALPGTREIQASVSSYPYDFEVWDNLMAMPVESLQAEGVAIERKHFKDINELVRVTKRRMKIGGHIVPVANLPYTLTSDAGNMMAVGQPFAACYMDTPDGRVFSLRSRPEGLDVSEIAKQYGGGGHKNAAGFRVGYDRLAEFLV